MSIKNNTTSLQELLEKVNNLPNAGSGGIDLPELTNEGIAEDLMLGKELINDEGNVIAGTFTIDNELTTQDNLIAQIQIALQNKASASEPVLQSKTVTPTTSVQNVTPDSNYDGLSEVTVNVIPSNYIIPSGALSITTNGTHDVKSYASVNVNVSTGGSSGGDGSVRCVKFTATPDSTTSFIIENPLGGIAKKVSIKAISPTITSSRKIHECCLDWDVKLGALKAYYSSGNVTYVMTGVEGTPNNGNFRMTDGFITAYRFNSATTWDTTCEYEVEIYQ